MADLRANEHIVGDVPIASALSASAQGQWIQQPDHQPPILQQQVAAGFEMLDRLVFALTLHRGSGR
jgi:hypothetical protein